MLIESHVPLEPASAVDSVDAAVKDEGDVARNGEAHLGPTAQLGGRLPGEEAHDLAEDMTLPAAFAAAKERSDTHPRSKAHVVLEVRPDI